MLCALSHGQWSAARRKRPTFPTVFRSENGRALILYHDERDIARAITRIVGLTIQIPQVGVRITGNLDDTCVLHGVCIFPVGLPLCLPEFAALVLLID